MAYPLVRALGRSGFVALVCALGCATGTQGDDPVGDTPDQGGSTGTAGSATAGTESGGTAPETAGTTGTAGSESLPFGGFTTGGTFGTAGTFGAAGTGSGGGGSSGAGASSGGAAGSGTGGKGGNGGSAGSTSTAGSGGNAGAGGGKAGGTCGNAKLPVTGATGTSENGGVLPAFAIDGDMTSRWGSEHSEPQNLDLDLGEIVTVKRVVINWEAAYATNYQVQIATSAGGPFTTIHTDAAGNGGTDDITLATASDGRYVRLNGITRKTQYGFSLYEISVYGDKDETCQ